MKMFKPKWNAILLECEEQECKEFRSLLQAHFPNVTISSTAFKLEEELMAFQKPEINLAFCNVHLRDGNTFEVLEQLDDLPFPLIFLAQNEDYVLRAFRYHAFDYLIKPFTEKAMLDVMTRLESSQLTTYALKTDLKKEVGQHLKFHTIILKTAGMQHIVKVLDIVHLVGEGNYSTVHLIEGEKIVVAKPLKHFEDILPARFFYRVHQSHIINLQYVKSVQNGDQQLIHLTNGDVAPLARRKKDPFLTWLERQHLPI